MRWSWRDEKVNPKYGILTVKNYLQKAEFAPDTTIELAGTPVASTSKRRSTPMKIAIGVLNVVAGAALLAAGILTIVQPGRTRRVIRRRRSF